MYNVDKYYVEKSAFKKKICVNIFMPMIYLNASVIYGCEIVGATF